MSRNRLRAQAWNFAHVINKMAFAHRGEKLAPKIFCQVLEWILVIFLLGCRICSNKYVYVFRIGFAEAFIAF